MEIEAVASFIMRHGKGTFKDGDNSYEGSWADDKMAGQGMFQYGSGATYEVRYRAQGVHRTGSSGTRLRRLWGRACAGGFCQVEVGVCLFADPGCAPSLLSSWNPSLSPSFPRQQGNWKNSQYDGYGVYKWVDGSSYTGQWEENNMHGVGEYVDKNGVPWEGKFRNGSGPGLIQAP